MRLLTDVHCHTLASGHAYGTVLEYVAEAKKSGLSLIAITDHAPEMPNSTGPFYFYNFKAIPDMIDGIRVMMGIELNILNRSGEVDMEEKILAQIEPVIASIHPPCYKFSKDNMSEKEQFAEITETYLNAMANKYIQIIGHPCDTRLPFDIEKIVRASLETGTLLEINNASLLSTSFRRGSRGVILEMLKCCMKNGCPIVASSDAHFPTYIGKIPETLELFYEVGFPEELVANANPEGFLASLKRC